VVYLGKVGTGFTEAVMRDLTQALKSLETVPKPIAEKLEDDRLTTWVEPVLMCDVQYASITPNGTLREPVFLYLREE
jgi:ATP-dependent DNA ligase